MKKRMTALLLVCWIGIGGAAASSSKSDPALRRDLQERRARIMERMEGEGLLVLFSAPVRNRSHDIDYEYRQESHFYYLTGIEQEGATLVMLPENRVHREILFLTPRNPAREAWVGRSLSPAEAGEISGIQEVWDYSELKPFLELLLSGGPLLQSAYYPPGDYVKWSRALLAGKATLYLLPSRGSAAGSSTQEPPLVGELRSRFPALQFGDASSWFRSLRMIKSAYEIEQIRRAIDISIEGHLAAMQAAGPGRWEYEVEAALEATFKRLGAFEAAYPSIVGSGPNGTILHYDKSRRRMLDGELLLIDAGAEYRYYAADITRTFPVNGRFNREQRDIYEIVLAAEEEAFKAIRPGVPMSEPHNRAATVIKEGLLRLGLITDTQGVQFRRYFMHGTNHFLGIDVHDIGERNVTLQPGMVFTVEPGIYVREDALDHLDQTPENVKFTASVKKAVERYKNIGVRIEDDVLVTESGCEVLSRRLPRTVREIEDLMRRRQ